MVFRSPSPSKVSKDGVSSKTTNDHPTRSSIIARPSPPHSEHNWVSHLPRYQSGKRQKSDREGVEKKCREARISSIVARMCFLPIIKICVSTRKTRCRGVAVDIASKPKNSFPRFPDKKRRYSERRNPKRGRRKIKSNRSEPQLKSKPKHSHQRHAENKTKQKPVPTKSGSRPGIKCRHEGDRNDCIPSKAVRMQKRIPI